MVESIEANMQIDLLFAALSDSTRRSILERVAKIEMSIGEIAEHYNMSFAAIAKHISVLEKAQLIRKQRRGKEQMVIIVPDTLAIARQHIERYAAMWSDRFDSLDAILREE